MTPPGPKALLLCGCVVLAAAGPACRERKPTRTYREPLEGIAEAINHQTGEVTMLWFNPKKNTEVRLTGRVTDETEYLINGRTATLADIELKERVKVTGYVSGEGIDKEYVVTRVEVEREENWIPTSPPTTRPATRPVGEFQVGTHNDSPPEPRPSGRAEHRAG